MPENSTNLTTREFADRTGLSASTVSQYLREGKIDGSKESGRWVIPEAELVRYKNEQEDPGGAGGPAKTQVEEDPPTASDAKTADAYSVDEFSRMTFLTPSGVVKYLKEGILNGTQGADGQWRIPAENLKSARIRHLIR